MFPLSPETRMPAMKTRPLMAMTADNAGVKCGEGVREVGKKGMMSQRNVNVR